MGLFTRSTSQLNWNQLTTEEQLDAIFSSSKVQLIFKHSTRCSISSMALNRFETEFNLSSEWVDLYFLDLIAFRSVSTKVAEIAGIQHESPQVIVIKDGKVIYHASHGGIQAESITEKIKNLE